MNILHHVQTCIALSLFALPLSLRAQQPESPTCNTAPCAASTPAPSNDGDPAVAVVSQFLARHKNFIPCSQNSTAMTSYLEAHNLNPLKESSFEQAFEELRRRGQLKIPSR